MARIRIINFGCSSNLAESEMMAGLLKSSNHELVDNEEDIAIVNACSVKGPSVRKWLKEVEKNKNVIVTGCITPSSMNSIPETNARASIVSTHNIKQIADVVELVMEGNQVELTELKKDNKVTLPKVRRNPLIEIIPVCNGCQFNCTYCATKLVKGDLYSYPPEEIIARAKKSIEDGCKQIWITSQDTGAYGLDINTNFPELLRQLLSLEGDFKVRVGMTNPNHVYRDMKKLIELYKHPNMFKFLHIPVQSGSDKVLKDMKRPYNINQYYSVVENFRREIPEITIATDIIVGFPGETEEDFSQSMELLRKTKPEVLNLSKYWKMEGTKAAKMEQLPGELRTSRTTRMFALFNSLALETNRKWIGKEFSITIDDIGKNDTFVGRNDSYRPVIINGNHKIGDNLKVRITNVTNWDLRATCL